MCLLVLFMRRIKKTVRLVLVFDYEAPKGKKNLSHKHKNIINEKGPQGLKNV